MALTKQQIVENINAMESQGASEIEIQEYLNSQQPSVQPAVTEPKVGFKEELQTGFSLRRERIGAGEERQRLGEQTGAETLFQKAGEIVGGAFDIGIAGIKALTPDKVEEVIKKRVKSLFPRFIESPVGKTLGFAQTKFEDLSPRQQDNVRAVLELLAIAPTTTATRIAAEATAPAIRGAAKLGAEVVEKRLAQQITSDALIITSPTLSIKGKTAALEAGKGKVSILREATIQPSDIDIKVAKSVEDVVKPSNNFVENIDAIREKIRVSSEGVGTKLRGNNTIFNKSQVRSALDETKEESRVIFGTDKTLEKNYDAVIDEFIRVLDKHPKNLEGLWAARIEFDKIIKKKFPNVFEKFGGDTVRSNAIQDVREAANNFIAQKLPEGSAFREELFTISDMYKARKNVARSAAELIDVRLVDKVMTIIRANPITSFATGGIVTIGALTNMIASPVILGTLLVVGTVRVGQKIFTARALKEALSKGLRTLEKTLKADEKAALEELIDELDKAPNSKLE